MAFILQIVHFLVDAVFPPRATQRIVRTTSFASLAAFFKPRALPIANIVVVTLLSYREPVVQACIIEAKYQNNRKAQKLLGMLLASYIREWGAERSDASGIIIPLPLGRARRKSRGYNQVEEIARFAVQHTSFTLLQDALMRVRDTVPQTSLGSEARKINMIGAFGANPSLDPATTYILLDDVTTTGATLSAAHDALTKAGAVHILVLALAH